MPSKTRNGKSPKKVVFAPLRKKRLRKLYEIEENEEEEDGGVS